MIQVKFKNLESSDLIRAIAAERINGVVSKFPQFRDTAVTITLEMENSPAQPGADLFSAKVHFRGRQHRSLTIKKSSIDLYAALAELADHLLESIHRFSERNRSKRRNAARQAAQISVLPLLSEDQSA